MSSSVYARIKMTDETKQSAIDLIKADKLDKAIDILQTVTKKIHIGCFHGGWQFKFAINPELYDIHNKQSIKDFLSRSDVYLYEEGFGFVTPEYFWKEFESFQDGKVDTSYDNKITMEGINYKDCPSEEWF